MLADAADIASIHRISRADYYQQPPDPDDDRDAMWMHLLGGPARVTHVAEVSGELVGFMSAHPVIEGLLELTAMYVMPSHFGRGIGSRLHELCDTERAEGVAGVLEVWSGNRRAIDFYRRRGWIETPIRRPGLNDIDFLTYELHGPVPSC